MKKRDLEEGMKAILGDAEPAPSNHPDPHIQGDENIVNIGGQMTVDQSRVVIINGAPGPDESIDKAIRPKKKTRGGKPLRRALRCIFLPLVALLVPLLFSIDHGQPPPSIITGTIDAITPDQVHVIQPAQALTPTGPLTVVPYQPGFHCHAGCSFIRPAQPIDPTAASRPQDI